MDWGLCPILKIMTDCIISDASQKYGSLPAVQIGDGQVSFTELNNRVKTYTDNLDKSDYFIRLNPEPTLEFIIQFFGNLRLGIVNVLTSPHQTNIPIQLTSPRQSPSPNQIATILPTSGTTGTPKLAVHSLDNYIKSAEGFISRFQLNPSDSWTLSLPLYHVGGLGILFRCLGSGAKIILPDDEAPDTATYISLVPTQFRRLYANSPQNLGKYKAIILGGAPLEFATDPKYNNFPLIPTYGLTEMTAMVTESGFALPNREFCISETGEILVRGDTLFMGYLSDNLIDLTLTGDNWFETGDGGGLDDTGGLVVSGRRDNMFISGGENIHPEEIEHAILKIPGIINVKVSSKPDTEYGRRPVADVETTGEVDLDEIQFNLREFLPKIKIPEIRGRRLGDRAK